MRIKKYSSDLSAKHWQVIEKLLIVQRKSRLSLKDVDAILYVSKKGCVWRDLPTDFLRGDIVLADCLLVFS